MCSVRTEKVDYAAKYAAERAEDQRQIREIEALVSDCMTCSPIARVAVSESLSGAIKHVCGAPAMFAIFMVTLLEADPDLRADPDFPALTERACLIIGSTVSEISASNAAMRDYGRPYR